jgi:hypothetical protein
MSSTATPAASRAPRASRSGRAGGHGHPDPAGGLLDLRPVVVEAGQAGRRPGQVGPVPGVDLDDVAAGPLLELARGAGGHDPAVVDDHDPAGQVVGLVQVLGGQQHVGAGRDQRPDGVPELDPAARVQPGGRLVQQQQPRRPDQAAPRSSLRRMPPRVGPGQPVGRPVPAPAARARGRCCPGRAASWPNSLATRSGSPGRSWPARRRRTGRPARSPGAPPRARGDVVAATRSSPPSGRSRVATVRTKVVLPAPLGPEDGQDLSRLGDQVEPVQGDRLCRTACAGRAPRSSASFASSPEERCSS